MYVTELSTRAQVIITALRRACFDDEFYLLFQPLLATRTARIAAVEVLLRWKSPLLGVVNATEFIPLAERHGLMRRVTSWVLMQALRQLGHWKQQGIQLQMAINISTLDLACDELTYEICAQALANRLKPENILLEVTETAPLQSPETAVRNVMLLRQAGFAVALDDYGAGHATLSQLYALPVSGLKIDRSLVQKLADEKSRVMVRSTIELAHKLGLKVVAEGVEDERVFNDLCEMNCDYIQGFHIGRPMPANQLITKFFPALQRR